MSVEADVAGVQDREEIAAITPWAPLVSEALDEHPWQELRSELSQCIGGAIFEIVAGPNTGSGLSIVFSVPARRVMSSGDPPAGRSVLTRCRWRLHGHGTVVCSSREAALGNGGWLLGLKEIVGMLVTDVELVAPEGDLSIRCGESHTLRLCCDRTEDKIGNYCLFTGDRHFVVHGAGRITRHPSRGPGESPTT